MMKLFKRILDFFNIHPDKNQRWTLSTVFVVGLLYTYVQPAITKAWVSELPAEWIAFQSLAYSICGLLIGMIWKISEFVGKCLMTFRPKLWNEHEREVYDNNNDVVCGIYCIVGYACSLMFMPSLQVAMFVWGLTCALDNIGWLVVYHKNRDKFREIENENKS